MYDITAQAVGYLGLIFGILAYQSNTHKKILLTKAASELFFGVQYVMLGAYTGMLTNLIGVIRNCTLSRSNIRGKRQIAVTVFFLFLLIVMDGSGLSFGYAWKGIYHHLI